MSRRNEPAAKLSRPSVETAGVRWSDAGAVTITDQIAEETPVALVYNGVSHVVMMASPCDYADLALGFSLSEGVLADRDELGAVEIIAGPLGVSVEMTIPQGRFAALEDRRRNLTGRTGCGLCGVDSLVQAVRPPPAVRSHLVIAVGAVRRALAGLHDHQPINRITRSLHAAAWADAQGSIALAYEDVGRHNALDKLIGGMARRGLDPARGFALITSRCSYELVQKAGTIGVPVLVAISAPTALAVRIAEESGVALVALARRDSLVVYTHAARIAADRPPEPLAS